MDGHEVLLMFCSLRNDWKTIKINTTYLATVSYNSAPDRSLLKSFDREHANTRSW